jgi:hypothetical protein
MMKDELLAFMVECEEWKTRFKTSETQSRERSLVVTKLDEARLWASEVLALEDANLEMP